MKKFAILACLAASPASAQLSGDAFTWGADVYAKDGVTERITVIDARKRGDGWIVSMRCLVRSPGAPERVLRYRGTARWEGGMMLGTLDKGMRITVVPREDGVGVVTSGSDCAQGAGLLTSGGG